MMEQSTRHFDPPDNVVAPAFAELLDRLRRAQHSSAPNPDLPQEERTLFHHGVAQRRRVLEHTLFLVFGQWVLYRQVVARYMSRPIRLAYACGAVMSSSAFLRYRATQVTRDLFAHIATAKPTSALANEARIVLAEMEGPEGPYFRSICQSRGFQSQFAETIAAIQAVPPDDHEQVDVHPQFRLTPRLLTAEMISAPAHPNILPPGPGRNRDQRQPAHNRRGIHDRDVSPDDGLSFPSDNMGASHQQPAIQMRNRGLAGFPPPSYQDLPDSESSSSPSVTAKTALPNAVDDVSSVRRVNRRDVRGSVEKGSDHEQTESAWGKPFDFTTASGASETDYDDSVVQGKDNFSRDDQNEHLSAMTPSQKRAAERRRRRKRAKARDTSDDGSFESNGNEVDYRFV